MRRSIHIASVLALPLAFWGGNFVPVKPPVIRAGLMEVHEPPPWTTAWFAKPSLPRAQAELMARSALETATHAGWNQGGATGTSFQEFHGGFPGEAEDYWVFRSTSSDGSLRHDRYFYQLGDSINPTLERVRWVVSAPRVPRASWFSFHRELVDLLANGKAPIAWSERESSFASILVGDSRYDVQLHVDWRTAVVESLVLERTTSGLIHRMSEDDPWGNNALDPAPWEPFEASLASRRARVGAALSGVDSSLAAGFRAKTASGRSRWPTISRMLGRSRDSRLPGEHRHLFRLAAHEALVAYVPTIGAGDSVTVREVRARLREFGSAIIFTHDGQWCYDGGLAESLLTHPAEDRWTEEAFLERSENGWEPMCGLCGWETPYGPDQWRAVLDRGGAFVRTYPSSSIGAELNLLMAEAHETAWSLSKSNGDDVAFAKYRLDASAHRLHAIELYEQHLTQSPDDPRNESIRRRLLRLRIDVDTEYQPFYCLWD